LQHEMAKNESGTQEYEFNLPECGLPSFPTFPIHSVVI